jgi:hypothetical protein
LKLSGPGIPTRVSTWTVARRPGTVVTRSS